MRLDENTARFDIQKASRDAMKQASGLRAELESNRPLDKYDELLREARLQAALDLHVSDAEKADLAQLQALLEQNRAPLISNLKSSRSWPKTPKT